MKKYEFNFSCSWVFDAPIKRHHFLLRCMPGTYPFQRTYGHTLSLSPKAAVSTAYDSYGNLTYSGSIDKNHTSFSFTASGFVLCSKYMIHEELDRIFLYPSRFTNPSTEMQSFLMDLQLPDVPYARALCLMDSVHKMMTYAPGETDVSTTASEAFRSAKGVSRDFVQVFITFCRMSGIPARYVIGLAKGVTRAHVWAEVYIDSRWIALDPTLNVEVEDGYLKIAHGRDYSDCAVDRYTYDGDPVGQSKTISATVTDHIILVRDTVPREA